MKKATGTIERRPGRPTSDGADLRERLLDAALQHFADQGIAATSLRALARDAGVTPAMLNYYFGSKDQLVETAVNERLLPLIEEHQRRLAVHVDADCVSLISLFVEGLHQTCQRNPWLPKLWVGEVLSENGKLRRLFIDRIAPLLPQPLAKRFAEGQANGELNTSLDPRLLFVSLIGLTMLPFAAAPIWRLVFAADDIDADVMRKHTVSLLTQGIGP